MSLHLMLACAGFVAGVINAVAGGGSLVSFPALLLTGMPSIAANATNTIAVWPGCLSSAWAYRDQLGAQRRRALILIWPSLLGALLGSAIVFQSSERTFKSIVPWLVLLACVLLAFQGRLARLLGRRIDGAQEKSVPWALCLIQFAIAIYGGYFGAGIGIMMLAALAVLIPQNVQHANALKVLMSGLINGMAAVYFLAVGAAHLPEASIMAVSAIAGGYAGAHLAKRLPAAPMRALVIIYGTGMALKMLIVG
ncbi:MAG TPA: sulfite exporter TauE/SafE family protein [Polyangiales bacterium]|nr:sulfite exporter TauE/SafE family protein [Polyangiales bacterium]